METKDELLVLNLENLFVTAVEERRQYIYNRMSQIATLRCHLQGRVVRSRFTPLNVYMIQLKLELIRLRRELELMRSEHVLVFYHL